MIDLLKTLYPLRWAPVSEDADKGASMLGNVLPFKVHEYRSGLEHNGWTVPLKWKPLKAEIKKDGKLIYDGMKHPLGVAGYSPSFKGKVALAELKKHLFYHPNYSEALVYHCDYYYKPWQRNWGFCVPYNLYRSLPEGDYEVALETANENGTMKVLDYFLEGETDETIILNAHNCHPAQANDDIAGLVVGIEVIKRLMKFTRRRFSYRLIIAPEHFGTIFYLEGLTEKVTSTFKYAMFLEMLGNKNRLALQESFTGESLIDQAAHHYLKHSHSNYFGDEFRKIVGNDETVWEAPGYEIPCISLSRMPYPEYHSSLDTENIVFEEKLEESVEAVLGVFHIMETNTTMKRHFNGLIALSNPKYDLYISTFDPSIRPTVPEEQKKWNHLMNCLIRYFDGKMTIFDIAEKHEIEYQRLYKYIKKYEEKGLVSLVDGR